jgi:hypothetical protein
MPELVQIILGLIGAGAIYGGIRADLKTMHQRIAEAASSAARAHDRMDRHVENFHTIRGGE